MVFGIIQTNKKQKRIETEGEYLFSLTKHTRFVQMTNSYHAITIPTDEVP